MTFMSRRRPGIPDFGGTGPVLPEFQNPTHRGLLVLTCSSLPEDRQREVDGTLLKESYGI